MKIEINDSLFEQYRQLVAEKFHSHDVVEWLEAREFTELGCGCEDPPCIDQL